MKKIAFLEFPLEPKIFAFYFAVFNIFNFLQETLLFSIFLGEKTFAKYCFMNSEKCCCQSRQFEIIVRQKDCLPSSIIAKEMKNILLYSICCPSELSPTEHYTQLSLHFFLSKLNRSLSPLSLIHKHQTSSVHIMALKSVLILFLYFAATIDCVPRSSIQHILPNFDNSNRNNFVENVIICEICETIMKTIDESIVDPTNEQV